MMLALALLLAAALPLRAQDAEPSPEALAAAREVLEANRAEETFYEALELGMREGAGGELPADMLAAVQRVMKEEFRWSELQPEYEQMYARLYTVDELRQIAAFYRTPLGRRLAETSPELALASQNIIMPRMQAALPRIVERIQQVMEAEASKVES